MRFFEDLDRTVKLTAGKHGLLDSTMKKTLESMEQAWNNNEKSQKILEKLEKSRVVYMADARSAAKKMDRM